MYLTSSHACFASASLPDGTGARRDGVGRVGGTTTARPAKKNARRALTRPRIRDLDAHPLPSTVHLIFPSRSYRVRRLSDNKVYALKETNVRNLSQQERQEAVMRFACSYLCSKTPPSAASTRRSSTATVCAS